ncbi:MAG: hypothetical protein J0I45_00125 [Bosea sp.]|nr:hypothetical protein [Bosea sp. (in: a-proteobacteria)]
MAEADDRRRLDAIEEAIASGATRVTYDGKSVDYRSLAEMIAIRNALRRQLGIPVPGRRTVATFRSGF